MVHYLKSNSMDWQLGWNKVIKDFSGLLKVRMQSQTQVFSVHKPILTRLSFYPTGFWTASRTGSGRLVVSSWAPQVKILSHGSTGALWVELNIRECGEWSAYDCVAAFC